MKISEHQMERRRVVGAIKSLLLNAIAAANAKHEITYAELVLALQEVQNRFVESMVVNEWDEHEEPIQSS